MVAANKSPKNEPRPARVLVLRSGAIGDFVVTLPVLQWLRLVDGRAVIDLACHARVAPLVHGLVSQWRDIDSAVFLPLYRTAPVADSRPGDEVIRAFLGNYDLVLSFLGSDTTPAQRLRELVGERAVCIDPIPRDRPDPVGIGPVPSHDGLHVTASFFEQMRSSGLPAPDAEESSHILPVIQPGEQEQRSAAALLDEIGLRPEQALQKRPLQKRPLLALHPGSGSARKESPTNVLAEVCAWLLESFEDAALVLIKGEADDKPVADLVARLDAPPPIVETPDLGVLAAVLARCALFVGHDSGVSHIAAAVGTPTVAVFVSTDPHVWAPRGLRVALAAPTAASIQAAAASFAEHGRSEGTA